MSSAFSLLYLFGIISYGIMFVLLILVIYALILAIQALKIYIRNNS